MKDYGISKSKKSQFILNYEKNADKIIINFANGDAIFVANNLDNEKIILESMKKQVVDTKIGKLRFDLFESIFGCVCCSLCTICVFLSIKYNLFSVSPIISNILFLASAICSCVGVKRVNEKIKSLKDFKKNKYYLEIEEKLNSRIKENENMLCNTHKVTKNIVNNSKDNNVVFTINNIDKVPFSDLEQMLHNIEREEKFHFEYPIEDKEKTKKKTK